MKIQKGKETTKTNGNFRKKEISKKSHLKTEKCWHKLKQKVWISGRRHKKVHGCISSRDGRHCKKRGPGVLLELRKTDDWDESQKNQRKS